MGRIEFFFELFTQIQNKRDFDLKISSSLEGTLWNIKIIDNISNSIIEITEYEPHRAFSAAYLELTNYLAAKEISYFKN